MKWVTGILTGCIILTAGCLGHEPVLDCAAELCPYIDRFESTSQDYGRNVAVDDLVLRFGVMENPMHRGYCDLRGGKTPEIVVNEEIWPYLNELEREALVFHELGHCILYRDHKDELDEEGIPESMMNTYALPGFLYEALRTHYQNELFTGKDDLKDEAYAQAAPEFYADSF